MASVYKLSYTAKEIDTRLGKIDNLAEKSAIPTKTSDLTNDSGFTTENYVQEYAQPIGDYALKSEIPEVPVTSVNGKTGAVNLGAEDVGALPNTIEIPTKTSDLTNDSGFTTEDYVSNSIAQIPKPNWNELEGKPFYAEEPVTTTEVTLEETTYEFVDGYCEGIRAINFVDGAECIVTWDGVEYITTSSKHVDGSDIIFMMGNLTLLGEAGAEDNGLPFAVVYMPNINYFAFMSTDPQETSHTVKIVSNITTQTIHKLDNKYIDAEWLAKAPEYKTVLTVPETVVTTQPNGIIYGGGLSVDDTSGIVKGSIVTIVLDGAEYTSRVIDLAGLGFGNVMGVLMHGDLSQGDPYCGLIQSTGITFYFNTEGDHTVSLTVDAPIYDQLPGEYIGEHSHDDVVKHVVQSLTNAQKTQARSNIDAASNADIRTITNQIVRHDITQTLTDTQKTKAISNIGAASKSELVSTNTSAALAMPGSLKWDGVIGDKLFVLETETDTMKIGYVHVSDEVPVIGDPTYPISVAVVGFENNKLVTYSFDELPTNDVSGIIKVGEHCVIVAEDSVNDQYLKKGVYFYCVKMALDLGEVDYSHVSAMSILGYTFKVDNNVCDILEPAVTDTLTWDGNTDGLTVVYDKSKIMSFYLISDITPSITEINAGGVTVASDDSAIKFTTGVTQDSVIFINSGLVVIATTDGAGCDAIGAVFPKKGIYFGMAQGTYTKSFTLNGYSFTKKVIDSAYLPEHLQFGEQTAITNTMLIWDGDISNRASEDITISNITFKLVHVSDVILTEDQLSNGGYFVETNSDGTSRYTYWTSDDVATLPNGNIGIKLTGINIVAEPNEVDGIVMPTGVYVMWTPDAYISQFNVYGFTEWVVETTITPINPKYLPEHTHEVNWKSIANKPFVTVGGDTLEWDGNTEGLETFDVIGDGSILAYKIADITPTINDFANGCSVTTVQADGSTTTDTFANTDILDQGHFFVAMTGGFVVIPNDFEDEYGGGKRGLYFVSDGDGFVSSLTIHGYTGFAKEQIDPAVLPDALQFGEGFMAIYNKTGLAPVLDSGLYTVTEAVDFKFAEGKQYTVVIDGVEYVSEAASLMDTFTAIGNPALMTGEGDNGLPFIGFIMGGDLIVGCPETFSAVTISTFAIKQIDAKYIPDHDGAVELFFDDASYLYTVNDFSDTSKRLTKVELRAFVDSGRQIYVCYNLGYSAPTHIILSGTYGVVCVLPTTTAEFKYLHYYTAEYTAS